MNRNLEFALKSPFYNQFLDKHIIDKAGLSIVDVNSNGNISVLNDNLEEYAITEQCLLAVKQRLESVYGKPTR